MAKLRKVIRRTDQNQREIVGALRGIGASVLSMHTLGGGVFDILVGYRGMNTLIELKSKNGKLTPQQKRFFLDWRGSKAIARNVEEAIRAVTEPLPFGDWDFATEELAAAGILQEIEAS